MSPDGREGRLGPALLVALLVASLAAGVFVYNSRTSNLALEVPEIERVLGAGDEADLPVDFTFFVRYDEPEALVEIVGSGDASVRTLASDVALIAEERIECTWDGTDDDGDPVAPGNYRLHVVLPGQDRDMVFPERIKVRKPPPLENPDAVVVPAEPCVRESGEALE